MVLKLLKRKITLSVVGLCDGGGKNFLQLCITLLVPFLNDWPFFVVVLISKKEDSCC